MNDYATGDHLSARFSLIKSADGTFPPDATVQSAEGLNSGGLVLQARSQGKPRALAARKDAYHLSAPYSRATYPLSTTGSHGSGSPVEEADSEHTGTFFRNSITDVKDSSSLRFRNDTAPDLAVKPNTESCHVVAGVIPPKPATVLQRVRRVPGRYSGVD